MGPRALCKAGDESDSAHHNIPRIGVISFPFREPTQYVHIKTRRENCEYTGIRKDLLIISGSNLMACTHQ